MQERYIKLFNCLLSLIIFIIFVYVVKLYFTPFFIILAVVFFAKPFYKILNRYGLFSRQINSLLSILFINSLFLIILYKIGYFIANNLVAFVKNDFMNLWNNIGGFIIRNKDVFNIDLNAVDLNMKQGYIKFFNDDLIKRGAVYTTEGIFAYIIGNIAAYFILSDGEIIINWLKIFIPPSWISRLKSNLDNFKKMFVIELALVVITTIQTILGLTALGIKNAVSLGVVCGILDILPYIGTIIVFIFLVINNILYRQYIIIAGLIALYVLLQINRQILESRMMSEKLNVHPLLIIISMYISVKLFGIIGLVAGPLYVVTVKEILSY